MIKELSFIQRAPATASPEDLAILEAKIGVKFPPSFVEFCTRWNGGFPSTENDFYPVPSQFREFFDEYPLGTGACISQLLGATEALQPCSLLRDYLLTNYESDLGIVPVAVDPFGNQVVLKACSPAGPVYWRDHELWEMPENPPPGPQFGGRPRLMPIAENLECFYNALTSEPPRPKHGAPLGKNPR